MKMFIFGFGHLLSFLFLMILIFGSCSCESQSLVDDDGGLHLDSLYTWSHAATNGYRAGIRIDYNSLITVAIHRDLQITGISPPRAGWAKIPPFLMPTNWFPGPAQLIGPDGQTILIQRPDVLSAASYPETLSFQSIKEDRMKPLGAALGPIWGDYQIFDSTKAKKDEDNLRTCELRDYYQYNVPGKYQLTLWPKLYRRSGTNDDIFHRIDLPPVSLEFTIGPTNGGK